MRKKLTIALTAILFLTTATILAAAQNHSKFNHAAQKAFIPVELGSVYLGMPFDRFAKTLDLSKAEVGDTRFDWLELTVPLLKGNIESVTVRIYGLTQDDKAKILKHETITKKDDEGNSYETEIDRLVTGKIPSKGFVYSMYIGFKKDFDLKSYAVRKYGKGEVRKPDDPYHIYDIQWTKKTSDGLVWLIRCFFEGDSKSLQLLGRIDGTEWDPNS